MEDGSIIVAPRVWSGNQNEHFVMRRTSKVWHYWAFLCLSKQLLTSRNFFPLQLYDYKRARKELFQTQNILSPFQRIVWNYDSLQFLQQIIFDNLVLTYENMLPAKCETAGPSVLQRNKWSREKSQNKPKFKSRTKKGKIWRKPWKCLA